MTDQTKLSRRERQIMDIIYARGSASASDVVADMDDPPSRTAVRTFLRILEDKGHLRHRKEGRQFVYAPVRPRKRVGQSALNRVVQTFFDGSLESALAAHLADPKAALSDEELRRLSQLIAEARKRND